MAVRVSTRTVSHSRAESVGKWMSVSLTVVSMRTRRASSTPSARASSTTTRVEGLHGGGRQQRAGAVEGFVLGHAGRAKARELRAA